MAHRYYIMMKENSEALNQEFNCSNKRDSAQKYTNDAIEIMQELADVQEEIVRINEEEFEDRLQKEINKAERIRQEVRMIREKDNFSLWKEIEKNDGIKNNV